MIIKWVLNSSVKLRISSSRQKAAKLWLETFFDASAAYEAKHLWAFINMQTRKTSFFNFLWMAVIKKQVEKALSKR